MHFPPERIEQGLMREGIARAERQMNADVAAAADGDQEAQPVDGGPPMMNQHQLRIALAATLALVVVAHERRFPETGKALPREPSPPLAGEATPVAAHFGSAAAAE